MRRKCLLAAVLVIAGLCVVPGYGFDLEITGIARPERGEFVGEAFTPECFIYNDLEHDTVYADLIITIDAEKVFNYETVYWDTVHVCLLQPGLTRVQATRSFVSLESNFYGAHFQVEHPDDEDTTNNDTWLWFQTVSAEINVPSPACYEEIEITFYLYKQEWVRVCIFDSSGRLLENLCEGVGIIGSHALVWDASDYPDGVYFFRLSTLNYSRMDKLILLR